MSENDNKTTALVRQYASYDYDAIAELDRRNLELKSAELELEAAELKAKQQDTWHNELILFDDQQEKGLAVLRAKVHQLQKEHLEFVRSTSLVKYGQKKETAILSNEMSLTEEAFARMPNLPKICDCILGIYPYPCGGHPFNRSGRAIFLDQFGNVFGEVGAYTVRRNFFGFTWRSCRQLFETTPQAMLRLRDVLCNVYCVGILWEHNQRWLDLYFLPENIHSWNELLEKRLSEIADTNKKLRGEAREKFDSFCNV